MQHIRSWTEEGSIQVSYRKGNFFQYILFLYYFHSLHISNLSDHRLGLVVASVFSGEIALLMIGETITSSENAVKLM